MRSNLGLSNPYLKSGARLVVAALATMAWTSFFSSDGWLQATARNIGGIALASGVIVYIIGRVVKARTAA